MYQINVNIHPLLQIHVEGHLFYLKSYLIWMDHFANW